MSEASKIVGVSEGADGGQDWLFSAVKAATARPFVIEYLPGKRANPLAAFSFGSDGEREASYRITFRGLPIEPHIAVARVMLRDDAHIRERLKFVTEADAADKAAQTTEGAPS